MKLVDFSIHRPVTVFIFSVAVVVFGTVAFRDLATDLLPDISYPTLTVRTDYDGAAPFEIESLVTRPVENAVGVVNNVTRVSSSSRPDVSEVTLEFGWGTDMDLAALDVRERLDVLRLPDDAERPLLLRYDPSLDPILRLGISGQDDLVRLRLIAEEQVKRALERIEGVAAAVVSGGLEEEILVDLDERRMANLGLTAERVESRLAAENVNLTGGRLREGQTEFLVRTINELSRPEDLEQIVIQSSGGTTLRLSDMATVRRGHKEREVVSRIDGKESVEIAVYKEGGTNTVTVSEAVRSELDSILARLRQLDPRLELTVITDQARFIEDSVSEVLRTALYGGGMAILVLFLFLRSWKTTLIVGIAIPLSVVATFFLMYLWGISLNIMSLGGLTLGIGLLVDNSIVVLEAIQRRRDAGSGDVEAARTGAGEVARAVVASTLTTLCVFLPIVFVEGVAGQLFGDQALTVAASLGVSLIVALTLIPMLASRTVRTAPEEEEGGAQAGLVFRAAVGVGKVLGAVAQAVARVVGAVTAIPLAIFHAAFDVVSRFYEKVLALVLRGAWLTVLVAFGLLGASVLLVPGIGQELIPELVQGELFVDLELPPGTRLEVTERKVAALARLTREMDGVDTVYSVAGSSNQQGGAAGELRENIGQISVTLTPPVDRAREDALMARLREAFDREPQLDYRFGRPAHFSFRTPVEVELRGYNLVLLRQLADELVGRMREIDGLRDIEASTEGGSPELRIRFDRVRLANLGLGVADVAATVRTKVQGAVATEIQRADRQVDIRIRSDEAFRDSVEDLASLTVLQQGKTAIPLSAVADIEEVEGPAEIRRSEGDRVALVTANLAGRDLDSVSRDIATALREMDVPGGIEARLGGQRQEMETSFASMRLAIFLAVFLVYLVMASQFESLIHPLVILFSVPLAAVGVLVTLRLFAVNISIVVLIGTILLAGIVVNNAIILVDYTNRLRRDEGLDRDAALLRAGSLRLRPILMTSLTTILGLLPMAVGFGAGNELRRPMALTVIGGLVTSTALTLLVVPALYRLVTRRGPS